MSLGRVASLHNKWARTLKGAMSQQCQELNALHSQSVDGARIRIPDRLTKPPEVTEPFVLEVLIAEARNFAATFLAEKASDIGALDSDAASRILKHLLSLDNSAFPNSSEGEIVNLCMRFAERHSLPFAEYLHHVDFSSLSAQEKYSLSAALGLTPESHPYVWNRYVPPFFIHTAQISLCIYR